MALDRIKYDIIPHLKELNLLNRLFYLERFIAEVNTNATTLMLCVGFQATTVNFGTTSNSARGFITYEINRLGPINAIELSPITAIDWYDALIQVRPVDLGVRIVPGGQETRVPGRAPSATTALVFDILPDCFPEDARHIKPVARRLYIDMEGDMTPQLNFDDGTSTTLTALSHATRQVADINILTANRIRNVTLLGDFTAAAQVLYDIEMDIHIPSGRRNSIG